MRVMMTSMFVCLALAGCGADPDRSNQTTVARDTETTALAAESSPASTRAPTKVALTSGPSSKPAASTPISSELLSCNAEIGEAAAAKRVAICRDVSPATHPPCNAVNSCAIIEDEIARSCALFDGKGAPMAGCGPAPKSMEAAAAVVRRYYSAINARDYATAWTQWGDEGRPGQTLAAFEAGFAHTRSTRVTIGALQPGDGGADRSTNRCPSRSMRLSTTVRSSASAAPMSCAGSTMSTARRRASCGGISGRHN